MPGLEPDIQASCNSLDCQGKPGNGEMTWRYAAKPRLRRHSLTAALASPAPSG